jgi:hypothetical protein
MGAFLLPRESGGCVMRLVLGIIVAVTMFVASAGIASAGNPHCNGQSDNASLGGGVHHNHPACD